MIRFDKYGRRIYSNSIWEKLLSTGRALITLGYKESVNKPNLFYLVKDFGIFYADMRGTEIVPIWDDPVPMFYWGFEKNQPAWICRREIKQELLRLGQNDAKCRLSFHFHDDPLFVNVSSNVSTEDLIFEWSDGYCQHCGKDFQDDGEFCSDNCEKEYLDKLKSSCVACGEKIDFGKEVVHHIRYAYPEKKTMVHKGCHTRIHHSKMYPELKPEDKKKEKKKTNILGESCSGCRKKIKPNTLFSFYKGEKEIANIICEKFWKRKQFFLQDIYDEYNK